MKSKEASEPHTPTDGQWLMRQRAFLTLAVVCVRGEGAGGALGLGGMWARNREDDFKPQHRILHNEDAYVVLD